MKPKIENKWKPKFFDEVTKQYIYYHVDHGGTSYCQNPNSKYRWGIRVFDFRKKTYSGWKTVYVGQIDDNHLENIHTSPEFENVKSAKAYIVYFFNTNIEN